MKALLALIEGMRPRQWTKNLVVLAPMICGVTQARRNRRTGKRPRKRTAGRASPDG